MPRFLSLSLAALALAVLAAAAPPDPDPEPPPPAEHLRGRPFSLHRRDGARIVDAPANLLKRARRYATFADKGKVSGGRRITILAEKSTFKVGERVWVIHVLRVLPPFTVAVTLNLEPVYALALAVIVFPADPVPGWRFYAGAAVLFALVILNAVRKARR